MIFWKIYFASVVISLILTAIKRNEFLQYMAIALVLCFIPVITSIWSFALLISFFEKRPLHSSKDYYLMYSEEHNNLFVYNEEQHQSYIKGATKNKEEYYECIEFSNDSQKIIKLGIKEAELRHCYFNSKFKLN